MRQAIVADQAITAGQVQAPKSFPAPVRLKVSGRTVDLRYPLTVSRKGSGLRLTIMMPPEEYVGAVLAGEVGAMQRLEVLKAMAVAARTFAVRFPRRHRSEGFDLCDTTHCQDLRLTWTNPLIAKAVDATDREVLWFRGSPAATYYSQNCGGQSEAAGRIWRDQAAPYLLSKPDPYCPAKPWRAQVSKQDLARALDSKVHTLRVLERSESGRVSQLDLGGIRLTAQNFRMAVGRALGWMHVRSDWFDVQDTGEQILFEGRGGGHGVGLCQQGAERMAHDGRGYRDILRHYYPGTSIGVNAQGIEWRQLRGERVALMTTNPGTDGALIAVADSLVREVENRLGLQFAESPELRVYPTVAVFRDSTGEPGWVAASTRGNTIRLQPSARNRAVLRHELLHLLIEREALSGLPRWYREGLVLALSQSKVAESQTAPPEQRFDGASAHRAYRQAQGFVQRLIRLHGEADVVSWSKRGIPPELQAEPPGTAMPSPRLPMQRPGG